MKKIFISTLFCFLTALCLNAQTDKKQEIINKIADINTNLPIQTAGGATIERMAVEDGYVVQYGSSPSMYYANGKSKSRTYGEAFLEQAKNEGVRSMYREFLAAGFGVKQVMTFKDTKKSESITFTSSELQRMLSFPASAYEQLLTDIREARKSLPVLATEGLVCIAYEVPQRDFYYVYEADESLFEIDLLQKSLNKNKYSFLAELSAGKGEMLEMATICFKVGLGMGMKYVGKSSGKSAEMVISYEELKTCFE